jgi:hypothetical protein
LITNFLQAKTLTKKKGSRTAARKETFIKETMTNDSAERCVGDSM